MPEWFPVIIIAVFAGSAVTASLTCIHMMQLASYQTPGYWRWLKRSGGDYFARQWPAAVIPLLGLIEHWASWAAACAALVLLAVFNIPKKAKKPFVLTPRAARIFAVQIILTAALGAGIFIPVHRVAVSSLAVSYLMIPLLVILSNWITLPVQRVINKRFTNDAKRCLASMSELVVIGVTGSYGKTSMKYILTKLLSERYETLMTPGSYNTAMGVVRTVREQLKPTHEVFVCEMGARHIGDIREICDIVKPRMGVLTAVGEQHLDTFGTLENVAKTKYELIGALDGGTAFLNMDSGPIRERGLPPNAVTYAIGHPADYTLTDLKASAAGSSFTVRAPDGETRMFVTELLGAHNALNILGAAAVAHTMGIPLEKLAAAARGLTAVPHRLQLIRGGSAIIIDDAYNANPHGVKAALDALALFDGLKILITPGMVELGEAQDACNRAFGIQAAGVCGHVVLVGRRQTQPIADGLEEAGFTAVTVVETIEDAMRATEKLEGDEKVILLSNDLPDNY